MYFEIELLPIKESKRFRVHLDVAVALDYFTGESTNYLKVKYSEVCYGTEVNFDRIKEYWDKVSDADKEIIQYCEELKKRTVLHPYTRKEEVGIRYSNNPAIKEILNANPDLFEKSFSEVPSYQEFPTPHNVVEHVGEFVAPEVFTQMITSARTNGKAAYLESRERIAQLIKDAA